MQNSQYLMYSCGKRHLNVVWSIECQSPLSERALALNGISDLGDQLAVRGRLQGLASQFARTKTQRFSTT